MQQRNMQQLLQSQQSEMQLCLNLRHQQQAQLEAQVQRREVHLQAKQWIWQDCWAAAAWGKMPRSLLSP